MGSLYLGYDPKLKRSVAIKLLNEDVRDDHELRERFAREAESLARLRHPNIVVVFDVGEDEESGPFMAMEYIAGETLKRILEPPSIPLPRRLALVEDLCAGLAHAHAAGIVHRDIKPENLMLDGDGVLKILDFGIARQADSGMTQDGTMLGTVNYMSPEQMAGRAVDHRSDIFAVGAVLYEAITLQKAFAGAFPEVYHQIVTAGPVPLPQIVPGVDRGLARIVDRALERDPGRRYQELSALREEIALIRGRLAQSPDGAATGTQFEAARRRDENAVVEATVLIERPAVGQTAGHVAPARAAFSKTVIAMAAMVLLFATTLVVWYLREVRAPPETQPASNPTTVAPLESAPSTVPPSTADRTPPLVGALSSVNIAAPAAILPGAATQSTVAPQPSTIVSAAPTTIPAASTVPVTSAPTSAPTSSVPVRVQADPRVGVQQVLDRYAAAHTQMDFAALRRVWPVAPDSIAKTFAGMQSYELVLESCDVRIIGADQAEATCVVRITAVPKRGGQAERRTLTRVAALRLEGETWTIEAVGPM